MDYSYYTGLHVLSDIVYQKPGIAKFPLLQTLPLTAGFSWGKGSPNMSYKADNKNIAEKAHEDFFAQITLPRKRVLIDPTREQTNQILEIDNSFFQNGEQQLITGANILLTREKDITLMVYPGDCPCLVLFGKDKTGQNILCVIHSGRKQTDTQLPKKAILYLESMGVDPETVLLGISPGISQNHFFIPTDFPLPGIEKWGKYVDIRQHEGKDVYFLNVQGYILQQLINCGVKTQNIEIYAIDTYEAAEKGESYSHRYATVTKQPEKDARFLFAASLK